MKRGIVWTLAWLLLAAVLSSGCNGEATATAPSESVPLVAVGEGIVVAEGRVEPARWMEVRAPTQGGAIVDVTVTEGAVVQEGDLLVAFDPRDAELAVEEAEASVAEAVAQLERLRAGTRPEELAVGEAQLVAARSSIAEAEARRDRLYDGEARADIAAAQASVAAAAAKEKQAFYLHERTMECFEFEWGGEEYKICPALGRPEEGARYAWHASQDSLDAAEMQLKSAQNQARTRMRDASAEVSEAMAREQAQQAKLDLQRAATLPDEISSAEAVVEKAEVSLRAAREALEDTTLRAPFDATVVEVTVDVGDTAAPGQILVVLATLDQLTVRTKDLIELDVVNVAVAQPVTITLDALPDNPLEGQVARIFDQPEDYRGDVTYPVIIKPLKETSELRWGMTASVEIDVD